MRICSYCNVYLETRVYADQPLCHSCFMQMDRRFLVERNPIQRQFEIEKLKYWYAQPDAVVDR